MEKLFFVCLLPLLFFQNSYSQEVDKEKILGSWKIKSFDTIDFIRSSPEYMNGSKDQRDEINEMMDLLLANTYYHFIDKENLMYTDVKGDKIVERKAIYNINEESFLTMKETERPFTRQAKIVKLSDEILIFSPVVNSKIGTGKMIFDKINHH